MALLCPFPVFSVAILGKDSPYEHIVIDIAKGEPEERSVQEVAAVWKGACIG